MNKDLNSIVEKLSLKDERANVAKILTLKKKQAERVNEVLKRDFNLKEYYGVMSYRGKYYEVTFDSSDMKLHHLFHDGDTEIENHIDEEQAPYWIKNAGLLRVEM